MPGLSTQPIDSFGDLDDIERRLARLECALSHWRDVPRQAPQALAELGIDHPDLRWHRASIYIRSEHAAALKALTADLIEILILEHTNQTAQRRSAKAEAPPPLPSFSEGHDAWFGALVAHDFGPASGMPTNDDLEDARLWAECTFGLMGRLAA